jgi:uncharacterized protein
MTIASSLPSYSEITKALKSTPANYNASQVHGLMCGLICATTGKENTRWEALIGPFKNKKDQSILHSLYEISYHQLSEFSFEFNLLLPSDKIQINQRTEALGLWCQGFMTGLDQGKAAIADSAPSEVREALNDLMEISQVNYEDIAASDEDETAYFELLEYVRLAALMIFHELKSGPADFSMDENNLLH